MDDDKLSAGTYRAIAKDGRWARTHYIQVPPHSGARKPDFTYVPVTGKVVGRPVRTL
jgi:hypothetical protein